MAPQFSFEDDDVVLLVTDAGADVIEVLPIDDDVANSSPQMLCARTSDRRRQACVALLILGLVVLLCSWCW